jgi:hypothetical protein
VAGLLYNRQLPNVFQAFIGSASGITLLPLPSGGWLASEAHSINDSGQVTGWASEGPSSQAFVGTVSESTVIPLINGWTTSGGTAINSSGLVAGQGTNGSGVQQVFAGTISGSTAIPFLSGATSAYLYPYARSLNDSGVVVGYSDVGGWIRDPSHGTRLLNDLVPAGWRITYGISISNTGFILAMGANGPNSGYLLLSPTTAAPPEGTMAIQTNPPSLQFSIDGGVVQTAPKRSGFP